MRINVMHPRLVPAFPAACQYRRSTKRLFMKPRGCEFCYLECPDLGAVNRTAVLSETYDSLIPDDHSACRPCNMRITVDDGTLWMLGPGSRKPIRVEEP